MMPSTGPKNSSRWKREPGCTPVRMPGVQNRPSYSAPNSRGAGSTSQASPSSRVVSAHASLPWGGSITGPTSAIGSLGGPTRSEVAASTSCRAKRLERPTGPTRIASDAAEHFWPAWPNALLIRSDAARSRSADGITIMAFLPLVSASSGSSGRHERNSAAVSHEPGEDHPVDVRVRYQAPPEGAFVDVDERQHIARDAGLPQRIGEHCRASARLRGGLEDDARPRRERGEHAARRDRDREVPRRGDDRELGGDEHGTAHPVELASRRGVVVREVDGFADLDVGFGEDLAGLGRRDLDQLAAPGFECTRGGLRARRHGRSRAGLPRLRRRREPVRPSPPACARR